MRSIAKIPPEDREALFRNTAARMGMSETIIEKDFWVCYMLDYLFHRCAWKNRFAFAGGTSLSKAYGLIERFSEDMDLILDWRVLGYGVREPWETRDGDRQEIFIADANARAENFLRDVFLPTVSSDLGEELGHSVQCRIGADAPRTVRIAFPNRFSELSAWQEIRLKISALAAWTPAMTKHIMPYAAKEYGRVFTQPVTAIQAVRPERTFWEKAIMIHGEVFLAENSAFPARLSRHYYDLYRMAQTDVKKRALADPALLARVVDYKTHFDRCPWARYDLARCGTLRLMPPTHRMDKLRVDYAHMQNMLFGEKPEFEEIMEGIQKLEFSINAQTVL